MEEVKFSRIIVPLDGSSTAEVALPYAEELAGRLGCNFTLIFVREPNDYRAEKIIKCYLNEMAEKAKAVIKGFQKETAEKELNIDTFVLTGTPADEIINFTEGQPGSCVIMATHGQSGTNTRWALGSVVDKVVRATSAPIGVIRALKDEPAVKEAAFLKRILVPLDGSKESESSLPYVKEMARLLDAEVKILRVNKLDFDVTYSPWNRRRYKAIKADIQQYMEGVTSFLRESVLTVDYTVLETKYDVADAINKYTKENPVDAIIMSTHGDSGPRRWILGSVANKVMMEGNTPVILIRTPQK